MADVIEQVQTGEYIVLVIHKDEMKYMDIDRQVSGEKRIAELLRLARLGRAAEKAFDKHCPGECGKCECI